MRQPCSCRQAPSVLKADGNCSAWKREDSRTLEPLPLPKGGYKKDGALLFSKL